jgi:myo-inositol-1(or 4)-monophosphatase
MKDYFKIIKELSVISSKIINDYYQTDFTIEKKNDNSPVTIADREAEKAMRHLIIKKFPEHGIIGEEYGSYQPDAEYQWVLDPIDGTKSFIHGIPTFGTLIALLYLGKPILGAIKLPVQNDLLIGDNRKTLLNDQQVNVRACPDFSTATLLTTDHLQIAKYQNRDKFEELIKQVKMYRTWGDCFGYFLLATGRADVMIDPVMNFWDIMALIPVIRGAGGNITDYQGNDPVKGNSIIAAHPELHSFIVSALNS